MRARPLALGFWAILRLMAARRPVLTMSMLEKRVGEADRAALAVPALRAHVLDTTREALRQGPAGAVDDLALELRPWGFRLEQVSAHVRLFQGDDDTVVGLGQAEHMAAVLPHASLTVVQGAGHLHFEHSPEAFEAAVG